MANGPTFRDDLRFALRSVFQNPRIFAVAVIVLGLGIGATTATLSIVDALFFRPLPGIDRSDQLVALYTDNRKTPAIEYGSLSYLDYLQQYSRASVFSDLAAYARWPLVVDFGDATKRMNGDTVSGNYFKALGARPQIGRFISSEDDSPASPGVAVISHRLWVSRFGGSLDVVGKTIRVNSRAVSIAGVAPEGFLSTVMDWGGRPDIWIPMSMQPQLNYGNLLQAPVPWHLAIGRLRNGVRPEQAQAALEILANDPIVGARSNRAADTAVIVIPIDEARFFPGYRTRLAAFTASLAGIAGLTLLIAGFNVANLFFVRLMSRNREFAIKLALGAKVRQLMRQLILEDSIVVLLAGAIGFGVASWTAALIRAFPQPFKVSVDVPLQVDLRLAAIAGLVTAMLAFVLNLAPLIHLSRRQLAPGLKAEIMTPRMRFGRMSALRICLLVQITVGTMLAAMAGLSIRSVGNLAALNPGFRPDGLLVASLDVASLPPPQRGVFFGQLQSALPSLPNVISASLAGEMPGANRRMRKIRQPGDAAP